MPADEFTVGAADEDFHAAGDDPHWNGSGWFGLAIPDRDINGFVYYFHDVRAGVAGGRIRIVRPQRWTSPRMPSWSARRYGGSAGRGA